MYDHLLLPVDESEAARAAFDHVLDIAAAHGATVHLLNVADTTINSLVRIEGDVIDVLEREGELLVGGMADRARERNVPVALEVLQGEPYRTIVDYAESRDIDLVVMPTHGRRGLDRFLLGSVTERVVRASDVPVLTLRIDGGRELDYPYRRILVPVDGSRCARAALEVGIRMAKADGAALHLLHVVETVGLGIDVSSARADALEEAATDVIEDARGVVEEASVGAVTHAVEHGSIYREIRSYVDDHGIDLVVVGTHGRSGLDRYLLGSVAEKVVRSSPVPVLTVRGPQPEFGGAGVS